MGVRTTKRMPTWATDFRCDLLTEAAVLCRTADPIAAKDAVRLATERAGKIATVLLPELIEPRDAPGPLAAMVTPRDGWYKIPVQVGFDANNPCALGQIGLNERIVSEFIEPSGSILCIRDGIFFKAGGFGRPHSSLARCIVFSNGPVIFDQLDNSILICDGEVRFDQFINLGSSLIISNDSIISNRDLSGRCTLIARKKIKAVEATTTKGGALIAGDEIDVVKRKGGEFGTHTVGKDKFDPGVRFFAVADVGLELKEVDGKAIVKSVAEDSPFRKSLKPGDRINSINDKFFKDFDDCRRVLREACVVGYAFVNRTRDGGHARVLVDLLGYPKPLKAK